MNDLTWKDEGYTGEEFNVAMPQLNSGHEHKVVNTETGERRTIHVCSNQTLYEAIVNGEQWTDDSDADDETQRL